MKKQIVKISIMSLMIGSLTLVGCSKKGCTDPNAINYNSKAKKEDPDNPCTYDPVIEEYPGMTTSEVEFNGTIYTQITGTITENNTLDAATDWLISGGVFVDNGATLTIGAGTTIHAANDGTTPFLSISQGGMINACGTASSPIIFTPASSNPMPGDWGGIIVNGYATINSGTTAEGEGGTGIYGGSNDSDNSGTLCYVRVEFAGKILGTDNELNGFSFNGVGSETTAHHLQAYRGSDDGFEFFGGTVNIKHCVSTGNQDDSFDWTQGWRGNGQFLVVEQNTDAGDRGFEGDNNSSNNNATPISNPTLSNITLIGADDGDASNQGMKLRVGTKGSFYNCIITGFPKRGVQVEHDATISNMNNQTLVMASSLIDNTNPFVFTSSVGNDTTVSNMFTDVSNNNTTATDGSITTFLNGLVGTSLNNAFDPTSIDSWFDAASYIGAIESGNDWTSSWTRSL